MILNILMSLISFIFPIYSTYKSIILKDKEKMNIYCLYWSSQALIFFIKPFLENFLNFLPGKSFIKLSFQILLIFPFFNFPDLIYKNIFNPLFFQSESSLHLLIIFRNIFHHLRNYYDTLYISLC